MTENLKKFLEYVDANAELKEKAKELKAENPEEAIKIAVAFARENGFELTEADFEAPEGELSENELSDVAGDEAYGSCVCFFAGGGGGEQEDGDIFGCACPLYGQGGDGHEDHVICICVGGGTGYYDWKL